MRVLVAGRHAKLLAQAAGACASGLSVEVVETKAAAVALLEQADFDLVIACERLGDGSGLEVLSHVAVNTPDTLRVFAARLVTLDLLEGELGLFGLFRTLHYPINLRALWSTINLARSCLESDSDAAGQPGPLLAHVPHVVLESEWHAGEPEPVESPPEDSSSVFPEPPPENAAAAGISATAELSAEVEVWVAPPEVSGMPEVPAAAEVLAVAEAAATTAPHPEVAPPMTPSPALARIPESEAFKRALARRKAQIEGKEPSVNNQSLGRLAQLALGRRPIAAVVHKILPLPAVRKRTVFVVGSGVAAVTVALVGFFVLNPSSSVGQAPMVAANPAPDSRPAWLDQGAPPRPVEPSAQFQSQPPGPQPRQPTPTFASPPPGSTIIPPDPGMSAVSAEEEAAARYSVDHSELAIDQSYSAPPPAEPPPGPSEPPWVNNQ
jgi:hypothetical protein